MLLAGNELSAILTGRTEKHVVIYKDKHRLHPEALEAFLKLQRSALAAGFQLEVVSSFRDYARQVAIWQRKVTELTTLPPDEIIESILRWSALPGTSRHHWGTDIDIFDAKKMQAKDVQLIPEESATGGAFYELHQWLDEELRAGRAQGFYRPYHEDRGGVSPEPWHLSFAPLAQGLFEKFDAELFTDNIQQSELPLKAHLLNRSEELYERFFKAITLP